MLDRPADDTSAFQLRSPLDDAFAPKRSEQRNKRQAENDEIVAVDPVEQLDANRFDLIGADRAQYLLTGCGEIAADELRREVKHGERGDLGRRPDGLAVGRYRDRGVQGVRLSVEIEQLPACRRHALGLRQDLIAEG